MVHYIGNVHQLWFIKLIHSERELYGGKALNTSSCKIVETLSKKLDFHLKMHSWKQMQNLNTFLTPFPPPSMLLLVTLSVITKSITALIRGEGGRCVLTMKMSKMTVNIASVSSVFAIACSILKI